jgi:fumarate hydratase class II
MDFRVRKNTFGPINVPARTAQRSMENFDIGRECERMPETLIRAFGILKKCAAIVDLE